MVNSEAPFFPDIPFVSAKHPRTRYEFGSNSQSIGEGEETGSSTPKLASSLMSSNYLLEASFETSLLD